MVSILFARPDSIYKSMCNTDVFDIERDARNFAGGTAVVAHPPCRAWGKLKFFAKPRPDEKELARFAVKCVRQFGGVLEHPAYSTLWIDQALPRPGAAPDQFGGWTLDINQSWFGHRAQKRTWLYIVGVSPVAIPDYSVTFDAPTHVITSARKWAKPSCTKSEREATPRPLAEWLVNLAKRCYRV